MKRRKPIVHLALVNRVRVFVALLVASPIVVSAYAQTVTSSDGQLYKNAEYGFSIEFPGGWTVKPGATSATVVKAVHKDKTDRLAMITVIAIKLNESVDLRQQNANTMFRIAQAGNPGLEIELLDSGEEYINGKYTIWLKIDTVKPILASTLGRKYTFIHGKVLFFIDAVTDRDPKYYARYEKILEQSVRTIRFFEHSGSPPQGASRNENPPALERVVTEKGDSFLTAFFTSFGKQLFLVFVTVGFIWVARQLLKKRRKVATSKSDADHTPRSFIGMFLGH